MPCSDPPPGPSYSPRPRCFRLPVCKHFFHLPCYTCMRYGECVGQMYSCLFFLLHPHRGHGGCEKRMEVDGRWMRWTHHPKRSRVAMGCWWIESLPCEWGSLSLPGCVNGQKQERRAQRKTGKRRNVLLLTRIPPLGRRGGKVVRFRIP